MSKKFTTAQRQYFTYELKTLGVLEALTKWQDELMGGWKFTIITDHEALEFFKMKNHSSGRHLRWRAFFAGFNCEIKYIEGCLNKVADALSRYYDTTSDEDLHYDEFAIADICLDRDTDDLPPKRIAEYKELLINSRLKEEKKTWQLATMCAKACTEP